MSKRSDLVVYLVVAAIALIVLIYSSRFEFWSAKMMPLAISGIVLMLAILGAVRSAMPKRAAENMVKVAAEKSPGEEETPEGEESGGFTWRSYLPTVAWIIGYFFGVVLVGFLIASPLFVLSYMKKYGSSWKQSIIVSAFTLGSIYGLFTAAFKVSLYGGIFARFFL